MQSAAKGDKDGESSDRKKGVRIVGKGRCGERSGRDRRSTVAWNEQAWLVSASDEGERKRETESRRVGGWGSADGWWGADSGWQLRTE